MKSRDAAIQSEGPAHYRSQAIALDSSVASPDSSRVYVAINNPDGAGEVYSSDDPTVEEAPSKDGEPQRGLWKKTGLWNAMTATTGCGTYAATSDKANRISAVTFREGALYVAVEARDDDARTKCMRGIWKGTNRQANGQFTWAHTNKMSAGPMQSVLNQNQMTLKSWFASGTKYLYHYNRADGLWRLNTQSASAEWERPIYVKTDPSSVDPATTLQQNVAVPRAGFLIRGNSSDTLFVSLPTGVYRLKEETVSGVDQLRFKDLGATACGVSGATVVVGGYCGPIAQRCNGTLYVTKNPGQAVNADILYYDAVISPAPTSWASALAASDAGLQETFQYPSALGLVSALSFSLDGRRLYAGGGENGSYVGCLDTSCAASVNAAGSCQVP